MNNKKEVLQRRLARLEESLFREQQRLHGKINNIGWGTGMRCTKCTPSFRREDEIKGKIEGVKSELTKLNKACDNLSESLQYSVKGEKMSEAVDSLDSACSSLEEAVGYVDEAML